MKELDNTNEGGSMVYAVFTLLSALCISAVAAYYSIAGLTAIFSGAVVSVAIMGGVLEAGKLVTASWLYNNWKSAPFLLKSYLSVATVILMLITSMGIFGYLSKAHLAQLNPIGDVSAKVEKLNFQIGQEQKKIDRANHILQQFDAAQDEYIKRGYVTRAIKQRNEQKAEIEGLQKEIKISSEEIDKLAAQKFDIQKDLRGFEAEVGPVKYIAQLVYGEDKAGDFLDKTVRAVIICLIFVFDPLAVLLVIAGNMSIKTAKKRKKEDKKPEEPVVVLPEIPIAAPVKPSEPLSVVEAPEVAPIVEPPKTVLEEKMTEPIKENINDIQDLPSIDQVMDDAISEASKKIPFNISGKTADDFRRALVKAMKIGLKLD